MKRADRLNRLRLLPFHRLVQEAIRFRSLPVSVRLNEAGNETIGRKTRPTKNKGKNGGVKRWVVSRQG